MPGSTVFVATTKSTTAVPEGQAPPPSNFDALSVKGDQVVKGTSTVGVLVIDPYQVPISSITYSTPGTVTAQAPTVDASKYPYWTDKKLYAQVICVGAGGATGTNQNIGQDGSPAVFTYNSNVITAGGGKTGYSSYPGYGNGGAGGTGSATGTGLVGTAIINNGGNGKYTDSNGGGGSAGTQNGPGSDGTNYPRGGAGVQVGTFGGPKGVTVTVPERSSYAGYVCGGGAGDAFFLIPGGGGGAWVTANVLINQGDTYSVIVPPTSLSLGGQYSAGGQGAVFVQFYINCNSALEAKGSGLNISSDISSEGALSVTEVTTQGVYTNTISGPLVPSSADVPYVFTSSGSIEVPGGCTYMSGFCIGGGGAAGGDEGFGGSSTISRESFDMIISAGGGVRGDVDVPGAGGQWNSGAGSGSYTTGFVGGTGGLTTVSYFGGGGGAAGFGGNGGNGGTNGGPGANGSNGSGSGGSSAPSVNVSGYDGGGTSNAYNISTNAGGAGHGNLTRAAGGYGGGGGGVSNYSGGGGGGFASMNLVPVTPGQIIDVEVGPAGIGGGNPQPGVVSITFYREPPASHISVGGQASSSTSAVSQPIMSVTSEGTQITGTTSMTELSFTPLPTNIQYYEFTTAGLYSQTFPTNGFVDVVCIGGGGGVLGTRGGDSYFNDDNTCFGGGGSVGISSFVNSSANYNVPGGRAIVNGKDSSGQGGQGAFSGPDYANGGGAGGFGGPDEFSTGGSFGYNLSVNPQYGAGGHGYGISGGSGVGNVFALTSKIQKGTTNAGGNISNYGGGAGGIYYSYLNVTTGGGGGGTAYMLHFPVTAGNPYTIKVGAAGVSISDPGIFNAGGGAVFIKFYKQTNVNLTPTNGSLYIESEMQVNGRIITGGEPLTNGKVETTGSISNPQIDGNDSAGRVTFTVGTDEFVTSTVKVTFAKPYQTPPTVVTSWGSPEMINLLAYSIPYTSSTVNGFTLTFAESTPRDVVTSVLNNCTINYGCTG